LFTFFLTFLALTRTSLFRLLSFYEPLLAERYKLANTVAVTRLFVLMTL